MGRDAIAAEELKVGDDAMDLEAASEICRKHFEEAFAGARRSVDATALAKYDQFRKKFDPLYKAASGDGAPLINWPDNPAINPGGAAAGAGADDEDDLYS